MQVEQSASANTARKPKPRPVCTTLHPTALSELVTYIPGRVRKPASSCNFL